VLAANRGRCPLTDWAARYTEDRAANFDIYLPDWLARNNKAIFGTLFAVNELIVLWRWLVLGSGAFCCLERGPEALLMRARRFLWYSKPYIAFG